MYLPYYTFLEWYAEFATLVDGLIVFLIFYSVMRHASFKLFRVEGESSSYFGHVDKKNNHKSAKALAAGLSMACTLAFLRWESQKGIHLGDISPGALLLFMLLAMFLLLIWGWNKK